MQRVEWGRDAWRSETAGYNFLKKMKKVLALLGDIVYNSFCRVNRAIAKR